MNFLVTAGNTQTPIDRVRCITNIFSGRTGAQIARTAWGRGHAVTLLTSNPEALLELDVNYRDPGERFAILKYATFDELTMLLQNHLKSMHFDAVCHSAAVSDYLSAGAYVPDPGTFFSARTGLWDARDGRASMTELKGEKIRSREPELWVRMVRAPKLIDRIRQPWGFRGILIKFKLEVGIGEGQLLQIAEESRKKSAADLMVANTLDGAAHWAYLGPIGDEYERLPRRELPDRLVLAVEELHGMRVHEPEPAQAEPN